MALIMIKYGELNTKKANRNFFIKKLAENIKYKLEGLDIKIEKDLSRMFISYNKHDENKLCNILNKTFGLHEYVFVKETDLDINNIKKLLLEADYSKCKTFKVEVKRSNKNYPFNSMELAKIFGGYILKNKDLKVDVHSPDIYINVEIRQNKSYVYIDKVKGLGGYPVGSQKKALMMLSGGIDSPVAAYLAMKRGIKLEFIYFESLPHTSLEAREKVLKLAEKIYEYDASKIKVHIINFTKMQEAIYRYSSHEYMITIMRRMMYRISEALAKKRGIIALVNGESIGQVASQTLTSMNVINEVTNMPIIRPVASLDKLEIIEIAKKIDTYETSIIPYEDCCTVFVPEHPVINPNLAKAKEEENKFDYKKLIDEIMKNILTVEIPRKKDTFNDVL